MEAGRRESPAREAGRGQAYGTDVMRRVVRGIGSVLIFLGVLTLLFVVYQLWGTGLAEARSQRQLKHEFARELRHAIPHAPGATVTATVPSTEPVAAPPPTPTGEAIAILEIPRLGVERAVVEGVGVPDLKKGPGHYPGTAAPGQPGNVGIAGHRTTYGAPFNRIDELGPNDPIYVVTRQGQFRYEVIEKKIVSPKDVSVLDATPDNRLTLTTCTPKYSAAQRLIVVARLAGPSAPAATAALTPTVTATAPAATATVGASGLGSEHAGLSGVAEARGPALVWGLACLMVLAATGLLARTWRRWPAYALGTLPFLVVLYFFFENFARLLPANI